MLYDPVKRILGTLFNQSPSLRILFYRLLDLLLLRTWHVKKALYAWKKRQREPVRILDAGSGFGQYTFFLSGMNPAFCVDAVDVKEEQIADCTRFFDRINRKNVTFSIADLTRFSTPETYDLILSVDVMEHILEDEQVFRNFATSLKPGGMVLISTPSDQGGSDVHDPGEESSFIDEHVRDGYSRDDIRAKLERAGFTGIVIRYTYGKPGQLGWKLSMKYPIKLVNISTAFLLLLPLWYLITFPVSYICNMLDVRIKHATGTGLLVTACTGNSSSGMQNTTGTTEPLSECLQIN